MNQVKPVNNFNCKPVKEEDIRVRNLNQDIQDYYSN